MVNGNAEKFHKASIVIETKDAFHFQSTTLPRPIPSPSEVLVQLSASGVCGTDVALASGVLGPYRQIQGHEGIGRVCELGSGVLPSDVQIGQRVGIAWQRDICGVCPACLIDGGETRCAQRVQSGRAVDGTFAEYTVVPARYLLRLPEGLSDAQIAPILCGGVTIYKALKICGAQAGQWICISGAGGGVGALGIQYAKAMGFQVVALDLGESKRGLCLQSGADSYIDVSAQPDITDLVWETTNGKGAAAVLVSTGSGKAYQEALGMLAPFGTLVCIGIPPPSGTMNLHPLSFIDHGYRIIGSAVGTRGDILEAIEFVTRGLVKPTVTLIELGDLQKAASELKKGNNVGKYVIQFKHETRRSKI